MLIRDNLLKTSYGVMSKMWLLLVLVSPLWDERVNDRGCKLRDKSARNWLTSSANSCMLPLALLLISV
jgi:hypothetical protein